MVNKLFLQPQEIETFYIIPTLRRHFASYLRERGVKQKDIAQILMIRSATISQYTSTKRGYKITLSSQILEEVKKSAGRIADPISYIRETQRLLKVIRFTGNICDIHKQVSVVPTGCEPLMTGCQPLTVQEKT